MSLPPHLNFQRLQRLHEQAHSTLIAAQKETTEQQLTIAKDATGHFDKLAGFCGATIVLVVSFLGGHKGLPMHWHILIPISIWILAGGMIAATARNIIYQHFAHRAYERGLLHAQRDEQEARAACLEATPNPVSMQTGAQLNQSDLARIRQSTADIDVLLRKWEAREASMLNWWIRSGRLAHAFAIIGIICLALLATKNV
jgi:hypothetical protein